MKTFAITGGVGMGKSTTGRLLAELGVPVVDTDELAREVVQPGQPALADIAKAFGPDVIGPDGELRRAALAAIVFADATARQRLEAITHPRIRERWQAHLADWRRTGQPAGGVVIPLLYEIGAEHEFDVVLCVACTPATQRERLLARGWSSEQSAQRIAAQWPVECKLAQANYVVWTEGELAVHREQLRRILGG
jgi:dephospho-CoA kinase